MQKLALIGAGFMGSWHARNLATHQSVDFVGVYDADDKRAQEIAQRYDTKCFHTFDQVIADPQVDGVVIASPTNLHARMLTSAAKGDKAVFLEKPIDLNFHVAQEAVEVARRSGVPVMVDFNRRFDPSYATLRTQVEQGELGDIGLVSMSTRGPSLPPLSYLKVSGGQMRDQNIHFFDLLCWITGLTPTSVTAVGSAWTNSDVAQVPDVDTSVTVLELNNGGLCQLDALREIPYGYDERIELMGQTAMAEAGRQRTGWNATYRRDGIELDPMHSGWFERVQHTYMASLSEFVAALEEGRQPSATLADGLRAQRIADAATESLATGRKVAITI